MPAGALELEVLETTALDDVTRVSRIVEQCHELGVAFALDDFGTGYSSLTYFKRLPADTLKIDQSFVCDMLDDPEDMAIVEGVIGLTEVFRRKVIAEGVESIAHGAMLLKLGCDLAQGYGIARPMPASDLPDWMRAWRSPPEWAATAAC
jgi:EAL domain-containing protein (putative c-di-GMP-specific phosphodiesterase class I)